MRANVLRASCAALALGAASCWLTSSLSNLSKADASDGSSHDAEREHDAGRDRDAARVDAARDAARDGTRDSSSTHDGATTDATDATIHDAGAPDTQSVDARVDAGPPDASCTSSTTYVDSVLAAGPLAFWRLDEATGPTAHDLTGHDNNAAYSSSGVTYAQSGVVGGDLSVLLNGTSGSVVVTADGGTFAAQSEFLGTQQAFTVEAWIKPVTIGTPFRGIVSNELEADGGRAGYAVYLQQDAGIGFDRYFKTVSTPLTVTGVVSTGSWYHVVAVYDPNGTGGTMTLYVDGESVKSTQTTLSITGGCAFAIGATHCGTASNFSGNVEDVAVYDYALPSACIQKHYALGSTP